MYTWSLNDFLPGFPQMPVTVKPSMRPLYVCLRLKFGGRSMAAEHAPTSHTPQKSFCATERASSKHGRRKPPQPEPARAARQTAPERQRARLRRQKKAKIALLAVCLWTCPCCEGESMETKRTSKAWGAGVCVCSEPEMRLSGNSSGSKEALKRRSASPEARASPEIRKNALLSNRGGGGEETERPRTCLRKSAETRAATIGVGGGLGKCNSESGEPAGGRAAKARA